MRHGGGKLAGYLLALSLSFLLANWLFRRFGEIPIGLTIPESWAERLPWLPREAAAPASSKTEEIRR